MPGGARGVEAPAADAAVGDRLKTLLLQVLLFCLLARCCCSEKQNQENNDLSSAPAAPKQGERLQIPRLYPNLSEHAQRLLGALETRYKSKSNPTEPLEDSEGNIVNNVPRVPQPKDHTGVGEVITSDIIEGRPAVERGNSKVDDNIRINQLTRENIKLKNTIKLNDHSTLENVDAGHNKNNNVKKENIGVSESIKSLDNPVNSELKHERINGEIHNKQEADDYKRLDTVSTNGGKGLPVVVLSDGPNKENVKQTDSDDLDSINRTISSNKADDDGLVNPEAVIVTESVEHVKLRAPPAHDDAAASSTKRAHETNTQTQETTTQSDQLQSRESLQQQKSDDLKSAPQRDNLQAKTSDHKPDDKPQGRVERNEEQEGKRKSENEEKDKDTKEKIEKVVVSDVLQKHNDENDAKKDEATEKFGKSKNGEKALKINTNDNEERKEKILSESNVDDSHKDLAEEKKKEMKIKNKNDHIIEILHENKDKDSKDRNDGNVEENLKIITDKKVEENMPVKDMITDLGEKMEQTNIEDKEKVKESKNPNETDLVINDDQSIISEEKDVKIESKRDNNVEKYNIDDTIGKQEVENTHESEKKKMEKEDMDKSREEKEKDFVEAMKKDDSKKIQEDSETEKVKSEKSEESAKTEEKTANTEEQPTKSEEPAKEEKETAKKEDDSDNKEEKVKNGVEPVKKQDELVKKEDELVKKEDELVKKEDELVKEEEELVKEEEELVKEEEELVKEEEELVKEEEELVKEEEELVKEEEEPLKKEEPPEEDFDTFGVFAKRFGEKEKIKTEPGHTGNGHGVKGSKVKSKNYASMDCGSKMITANPEAQHASKVIAANKDEYLLNKCIDKTWFIVELCESIHPQRFDVANFELFSNLPKDIVVYGSHRFPTRDWTMLGRFLGLEGNRGIQSFNIDMEGFYKYIKVEVLSHYGSEVYCPISLFRIYGLSEFEVIEDTYEGTDETEDSFYPSEVKTKEPSGFPDVLKTMLNNVMDVIKRGYRPAVGSGEPTDACQSLSPSSELKPESCLIAEHINYILKCYSSEYQDLMQRPAIASAVNNTPLCHQLVSVMCATPHIKDSLVYDTACNNSYVCVMLSPKHVLAMCFMKNPALLSNTGHSAAQLGCSGSTSEIGCSDSIADNVSIKSIPALSPSSGEAGSVGSPPLMVNNNLINTSTVTRSDDSRILQNGSEFGTASVTVLSVDDAQHQPAAKIIGEEIDQEKKKESENKEVGHKDTSTSGASTQEKKNKKEHKKQLKEEQKEQDDLKKNNGEKHQGNGHASIKVGGEMKDPDIQLNEEISLTTPTPVEPAIPETKVPQTPTNKESVMVRLSNKIKALEANVTISSAYLEELSIRYKRQMEDMNKAFNTTAQVAYERDLQHQKDISELKEHLEVLTGIVTELQSERVSLANTVVEQHLLLMLLEVLVLTLVFTWCNRRRRVPELNPGNSGDVSNMQRTKEETSRTESNSNWPPQYYKCGHNRRNSLDSVMGEREVRPRRQRRLSEDGLNITGTYSDLLIIEPAIPIMMDSHYSERKKKRKNGSLKRSKSNSNIRRGEKYSPNPRRVKDKIERVSSAGVLFVGDKQVSAPGDVSQTQPQANELHNNTLNDSILETSLDDSKLSQNYTHRSFVDEIDGGAGLGSGSGDRDKDPIECCVNCDELSKSRALSLTKSLSLNGKEKVKKGKKLKRSKSINKTESKDNIYNEHSYATTNGSSVSFGYESTLPFGGYCYDSRDLTDYTQYTNATAHLNGHNSYDYYNGYYGNSRTEADSLVTSWVSNNLSYDPLLPSINGQRGYEDLSSKTKLRSDNWEWYAGSGQSMEITENISGSAGRGPLGSCSSNETVSETISTCSSDSSGKNQRGKSQDKKTRSGKKKKSKSHKNPNVVEEEVGEVT